MLHDLGDGKFQATWPTLTARTISGHYLTARPETVEALLRGTVFKVIARGEAQFTGTKEECERQL